MSKYASYASQASTTAKDPLPSRTGPCQSITGAPTTTRGSRPAAIKPAPSIPVLVVLPCVPVTAMIRYGLSIQPRTWERRKMGIPNRRASLISGLVSRLTASVTTIATEALLEQNSDTELAV